MSFEDIPITSAKMFQEQLCLQVSHLADGEAVTLLCH